MRATVTVIKANKRLSKNLGVYDQALRLYNFFHAETKIYLAHNYC